MKNISFFFVCHQSSCKKSIYSLIINGYSSQSYRDLLVDSLTKELCALECKNTLTKCENISKHFFFRVSSINMKEIALHSLILRVFYC